MALVKSCRVTKVQFKTARGKLVSFPGRTAGSKVHGGECPAKRPSAAVRKHRAEFGRQMSGPGKKCMGGIVRGKNFAKRLGICMRNQMKSV